MSHELKRLYRGEGITQEIKPSCSCGWVGIGYEAWNDYQHTMVKDQETEHLRFTRDAPSRGDKHGMMTMTNAELATALEVAHDKCIKSGTAQPHYLTWQAHLKELTAEQARRAAERITDSGSG